MQGGMGEVWDIPLLLSPADQDINPIHMAGCLYGIFV